MRAYIWPTIEVTVKDGKGKCAFAHKVGDKITFDGRTVKGDMCYSALTVYFQVICNALWDKVSMD